MLVESVARLRQRRQTVGGDQFFAQCPCDAGQMQADGTGSSAVAAGGAGKDTLGDHLTIQGLTIDKGTRGLHGAHTVIAA